jgi:trans-aconitate methyltransferase
LAVVLAAILHTEAVAFQVGDLGDIVQDLTHLDILVPITHAQDLDEHQELIVALVDQEHLGALMQVDIQDNHMHEA